MPIKKRIIRWASKKVKDDFYDNKLLTHKFRNQLKERIEQVKRCAEELYPKKIVPYSKDLAGVWRIRVYKYRLLYFVHRDSYKEDIVYLLYIYKKDQDSIGNLSGDRRTKIINMRDNILAGNICDAEEWENE